MRWTVETLQLLRSFRQGHPSARRPPLFKKGEGGPRVIGPRRTGNSVGGSGSNSTYELIIGMAVPWGIGHAPGRQVAGDEVLVM